MYDKVQEHWNEHIAELKTALTKTVGDERDGDRREDRL